MTDQNTENINMEVIKIHFTLDIKYGCHVTGLKGSLVTSNDIPYIPYIVAEEMILEEYRKLKLKLPKTLFKVNKIVEPMGKLIPITSIFPKLQKNKKAEVFVEDINGDQGFRGQYSGKIYVNVGSENIEELKLLLGVLKSLQDSGFGGHRSRGFGECEFKIIGVNDRAIEKSGIFAEMWDLDIIEPKTPTDKLSKFITPAKFNAKSDMWNIHSDHRTLVKKWKSERKKLIPPTVEVKYIIPIKWKKLSGQATPISPVTAREHLTDMFKSMGIFDNVLQVFGGREGTQKEYRAYEAEVKFGVDRILIESTERKAEFIWDNLKPIIGDYVSEMGTPIINTKEYYFKYAKLDDPSPTSPDGIVDEDTDTTPDNIEIEQNNDIILG